MEPMIGEQLPVSGYQGAISVETKPYPDDHDPFPSYAYSWDGVLGYQRASPGQTEDLRLERALYDTAHRGSVPAVSTVPHNSIKLSGSGFLGSWLQSWESPC